MSKETTLGLCVGTSFLSLVAVLAYNMLRNGDEIVTPHDPTPEFVQTTSPEPGVHPRRDENLKPTTGVQAATAPQTAPAQAPASQTAAQPLAKQPVTVAPAPQNPLAASPQTPSAPSFDFGQVAPAPASGGSQFSQTPKEPSMPVLPQASGQGGSGAATISAAPSDQTGWGGTSGKGPKPDPWNQQAQQPTSVAGQTKQDTMQVPGFGQQPQPPAFGSSGQALPGVPQMTGLGQGKNDPSPPSQPGLGQAQKNGGSLNGFDKVDPVPPWPSNSAANQSQGFGGQVPVAPAPAGFGSLPGSGGSGGIPSPPNPLSAADGGNGGGPLTPPITVRPKTDTGIQVAAGPSPSFPNQPVVESYTEKIHTVAPAETSFAAVSKTLYGSDQYGPALAEYNRTHPNGNLAYANFRPGAVIYYPSLDELQRRTAGALAPQQPAAVVPVPPISVPSDPAKGFGTVGNPPAPFVAPAPVSGPPTYAPLPSPSPSPQMQVPASAQPVPVQPMPAAGPSKTYTVVAGGPRMISEIAAQMLGNFQRWPEIYRLNPNLEPSDPIPPGTQILLPADARGN
jgi:hypothetical protein